MPADVKKEPVRCGDVTSALPSHQIFELSQALHSMSGDLVDEPLQIKTPSQQLHYGVECKGFHLLIDASVNGEVVVDAVCYGLPNTAESFIGLHISRGDMVPVYSLPFYSAQNIVFDKDRVDVVSCSRVLLLGKADERVGFALDQTPVLYDVSNVKTVAGRGHLPKSFDDMVLARYVQEGVWWLTLDWLRLADQLSQG